MEIAPTGTRITTTLPSQVGGTQDGPTLNAPASTVRGAGSPAGQQAIAGGGNLDLASVVDTLRGLLTQLTAMVGARGGDMQAQAYGGRMTGEYGMSCESGCCGTKMRAGDDARVAGSRGAGAMQGMREGRSGMRGGGESHAAHMHG